MPATLKGPASESEAIAHSSSRQPSVPSVPGDASGTPQSHPATEGQAEQRWQHLLPPSWACVRLYIHLKGHLLSPVPLQVHSVAWNCAGDRLASGSTDQTIRIWALPPPSSHHGSAGNQNRATVRGRGAQDGLHLTR